MKQKLKVGVDTEDVMRFAASRRIRVAIAFVEVYARAKWLAPREARDIRLFENVFSFDVTVSWDGPPIAEPPKGEAMTAIIEHQNRARAWREKS